MPGSKFLLNFEILPPASWVVHSYAKYFSMFLKNGIAFAGSCLVSFSPLGSSVPSWPASTKRSVTQLAVNHTKAMGACTWPSLQGLVGSSMRVFVPSASPSVSDIAELPVSGTAPQSCLWTVAGLAGIHTHFHRLWLNRNFDGQWRWVICFSTCVALSAGSGGLSSISQPHICGSLPGPVLLLGVWTRTVPLHPVPLSGDPRVGGGMG